MRNESLESEKKINPHLLHFDSAGDQSMTSIISFITELMAVSLMKRELRVKETGDAFKK